MATSAPAPGREAPQRERAVIRVRTLVAAALIVLAVVALAFLLSSILSILLVVLVAIVFAEGIRPLMHALQRRRLPAPLAVVVVYLGLLLFLGVMVALLVQPIVSEAQTLAANFPTYRSDFLQFFNNLENQFHFNVDVSKQVGTVLGAAQQVLFTIGGTLFSIVVNFFLVLVLGFLWLLSSERLKRFVVDLVPPHHQALAQDVIREVGFRMGGFVRAMAINSLVVGIATGVACALLRLPSPILLGIFAALAAAVPVVGAFLGVVPPVLLGFTISPQYPILVAVVLLVVQLIDANTVVPLVMNRVVALPALAVVLALLIGGALAGVIGALLAVPMAAALQVVILRVGVPAVHRAQGRDIVAVGAAATPPPHRPSVMFRVLPRLRRQ